VLTKERKKEKKKRLVDAIIFLHFGIDQPSVAYRSWKLA
jgi:hypothetical protein